MFRLINSHLKASSLQVKSQDAVHTLVTVRANITSLDSHIPAHHNRIKGTAH